MNQDIKRQWVEALRSGEYKQTRGTLCRTEVSDNGDPVGYCCLGVLTDIASRADVIEWSLLADGRKSVEEQSGEYAETDVLPKAVQRWADFGRSDPVVFIAHGAVRLTDLNDDARLSFEEIADLIERDL